MRISIIALPAVLLAPATAVALAVTDARFADEAIIVQGTTDAPWQDVVLDDRYRTRSGADSRFSFRLDYQPGDCAVDLRTEDKTRQVRLGDCPLAGLPLGSTPLVDERGEQEPGAIFRTPRIVDPTMGDPAHAFEIPKDLVVPRRPEK